MVSYKQLPFTGLTGKVWGSFMCTISQNAISKWKCVLYAFRQVVYL